MLKSIAICLARQSLCWYNSKRFQRERKGRQVISGEVAAEFTLAVGNVTIRIRLRRRLGKQQ
jgi:hypothetical protein